MNARLSTDILKKIRHIEISTRRLLNGSLVGDSRSAVKGSGFEFDQIREYQAGDDIRFIDWAGSARTNKVLVKQYIEERNRTILLALDVSGSGIYSSGYDLRSDVMAHLTSALALVADYGKDSVGLLLFSDEVELFIPPARGRSHVRSLMEKAFSHKARGTRTNIANALNYIAKLNRRDAMVFVVSDFIDQHNFEKSLRSVARTYDMIAVRCLDIHEEQLPSIGFVTVKDPETGTVSMLDMRARSGNKVRNYLTARAAQQQSLFKKYAVDCVDIKLNKPFMDDMIRFFCRRMMY